MTPIDNTQGETPITDSAVFKLPIAEIPGEEIIVKEFVGAGIARKLERELQQAAAERDAFSKKIINLTCGIGADAKEFLSVPEMSVALLWRNQGKLTMLSVDKMIEEVIMQGVGCGDGFSNCTTARAGIDDDNLTVDKLMARFEALPPAPTINGRIAASEAVQEQYRFPRTKKRRIRNKWAKRMENFRPARHAWVIDGTIYVHPTKLSLLNAADVGRAWNEPPTTEKT